MDVELLEELLLRQQRTQKHLEEIESEIKTFEAMKNHEILVKFDRQQSCYFLEGRAIRDTDPRWLPIISDIAHQLRSSLDNLVYAVRSPNGATDRNLAFPIVDHPAQINGRDFKRAIEGVPAPFAALIERLQPCSGHNLIPNDRALPALRVLSNRDKHRHGHATIIGIDESKRWGVGIQSFTDCAPGKAELLVRSGPIDHAKVIKIPVRITGPNPQMAVKDNIATCVAFGNRVAYLKDAPVREVLWLVGAAVVEVTRLFIEVKP